MARSLYVMPIITTATPTGPSRTPKYLSLIQQGASWSMFDYGDEPQCLVGVTDIPPAADTSLTANNDVFALPANLDTTVGSVNTRNALRTRLEQSEFPGTWVQTTTTYRETVRTVGADCQFAQRYQGLVGGPWFSGTVHVANTFSTLSQAQQNGILATAQSFGFSTAAIVGTATIRDVLKNVADQYIAAGLPLNLEGPL
jgi:hypothetical protein